MIDWWFGWHGVETERYRLWHPQAHLFAQMRYERTVSTGLTNRERFIGNTSYVDEYIGPSIFRLAITFQEPRDFGLDQDSFGDAGVSTAICARVGFSDKPVDSGYLVHLVRETTDGCEMRSRFWLGEPHLRALPERNPSRATRSGPHGALRGGDEPSRELPPRPLRSGSRQRQAR
jgi:hypothetical protein